MNHSSLERLENKVNDNKHPTITYDPRGTGLSDKPYSKEYYTLERYSGDVKKILEAEGIEKPVFWTHSMGFMPTVDYTAETRNAKQFVSVCGSHNFKETASSGFLFHAFDKVLRYFEYFGSSLQLIRRVCKSQPRDYPDQSNMGKGSLTDWNIIVDAPFSDIKAHTVSGRAINRFDISRQLRNIDQPVLLFYGNRDPMVHPKAGEYISRLAKGQCKVHILEGTHSLPMERAEEIVKLAEKFWY